MNNAPLRVTHVITGLEIGGAESALCTLVEALRGEPINHTVVSLLKDGPLAPRLRAAGAEVIELNGVRGLSMLALLPMIGRVIAASRPAVAQGWMYHANLALSAAAKAGFFSAPCLWGVRQTLSSLAGDRFLTRAVILAALAFRGHPHRIVYNSAAAAADHVRYGYPAAKAEIIHNAVDCERFRPDEAERSRLRAALRLPDDTPLIGRVGRNARMKDHETLFGAFALIRRRMPAAHLVLAGEGMVAGDKTLSDLCGSHGLAGAVHFLGPRLDIERFYPALDLFLSSSSDTEGFPNVVAEAMACGVPAIATDVGESGFIVASGNLIVPPRRPDKLAEAALNVLQADATAYACLRKDVRGSIETRFAAKAAAQHFVTLWRAAGGQPA